MKKEISFLNYINLASDKLGARSIACSDDFFAPMSNLVKPGRGIFIPDKYTEYGKWMDGWESRRKRTSGYDWCIVALGAPGIIHGFDVDTNHFLGNHPPHCSIDACVSLEDHPNERSWQELLPKSELNPGSQHFFEIEDNTIWTHIRLNIYPDGGVARLKVYGEVKRDWSGFPEDKLIDLAAAINGGKSILCNDMFFSHMDNLIMPKQGINMGDGWETKRNRNPDNRDWVLIRMAHQGQIEKIELDTRHFKGNYPEACLIEACNSNSDDLEGVKWETVLPKSKLSADKIHYFEDELISKESFTHVRLSIFPDGGVSRLRLWGYLRKSTSLELLNQLDIDSAAVLLGKCCGSTRWIHGMLAQRPFINKQDLMTKADLVWAGCTVTDAFEAFSHHPKIGDRNKLVEKFASTQSLASEEQKSVRIASSKIIDRLIKGNINYETKFGYIFIVCATGKSAEEMLNILEERLKNDPEEEMQIAMGEQHKITRIRIEKLIS